MGRVVTFAQLARRGAGQGVSVAAVTAGDTKEMAADIIRIEPGHAWQASGPAGADCYLFGLKGHGFIAAGEAASPFAPQTFATVAERMTFTLSNSGATTAEILRVIAPPHANGTLAGFAGRIAVAERARTAVVDVADQKKKRIYFVGHEHGAKTERGHAMIVVYAQDTVTALHHHPDAESMFVPLDGALAFTVNGGQVTVGPGQAAYFGMHDKHGLHVAAGQTGASFLEFHIPGAFTTVKE